MLAQPIGQVLYGFLFNMEKTILGIAIFCISIVLVFLSIYSKKIFKNIND